MKTHLELPDTGQPLCNTASARLFTFEIGKVTCTRCFEAEKANHLWYKSKLLENAVPADVLERALFRSDLDTDEVHRVMAHIHTITKANHVRKVLGMKVPHGER